MDESELESSSPQLNLVYMAKLSKSGQSRTLDLTIIAYPRRAIAMIKQATVMAINELDILNSSISSVVFVSALGSRRYTIGVMLVARSRKGSECDDVSGRKRSAGTYIDGCWKDEMYREIDFLDEPGQVKRYECAYLRSVKSSIQNTISTAIDEHLSMEEMALRMDEKKAEYERKVTGKILATAA